MKLVEIDESDEHEFENNIIKQEPEQPLPFSAQEMEEAVTFDSSRDYRQEMIEKYANIDPEDDRDGIDDFIEEKDRESLVKYISAIVKQQHPYFPSSMEALLVKKAYLDSVERINRDEYLAEKAQQKQLDSVNKVLKVIEDEDNLSYALKQQ